MLTLSNNVKFQQSSNLTVMDVHQQIPIDKVISKLAQSCKLEMLIEKQLQVQRVSFLSLGNIRAVLSLVSSSSLPCHLTLTILANGQDHHEVQVEHAAGIYFNPLKYIWTPTSGTKDTRKAYSTKIKTAARIGSFIFWYCVSKVLVFFCCITQPLKRMDF